MILHIGIDDVDSSSGGCTTHLATILAYYITKEFFNAYLVEPLNLVRLNPSIPWKTRGNGAVAIRIHIEDSEYDNIVSFVEHVVDKYSRKFFSPGQSPGLAVSLGTPAEPLAEFYLKAVSDIVSMTYVMELQRRGYVKILRKGRGVIGAVAAIGWAGARRDFTYELLVYRRVDNYGKERCLDVNSVYEFDRLAKHSFNNVYGERILIAPHGPDPVLYGVRGDDPEELAMALRTIRVCEEIAGYALFITNQATDDHVQHELCNSSIKPYRCGWLRGTLIEKPLISKGGHCILKLLCYNGVINVIAFHESGLPKHIIDLEPGSRLMIQGCIKPFGKELFLHAEKIFILSQPLTSARPRKCPRCGSNIKYMGAGRGYKCITCGLRIHLEPHERISITQGREVRYLVPPPHRQKHLVKPLLRCINPVPYKEIASPMIAYYEPLDFL